MTQLYEFVFHLVEASVHWKDGPFASSPAVFSLLIPSGTAPAVVFRSGAREELPRTDFEQAPRLLLQLTNGEDRLVEGNETGNVFVHWGISGHSAGRAFALDIDFVSPGERWTEWGSKLEEFVNRVRNSRSG